MGVEGRRWEGRGVEERRDSLGYNSMYHSMCHSPLCFQCKHYWQALVCSYLGVGNVGVIGGMREGWVWQTPPPSSIHRQRVVDYCQSVENITLC